jgi:arylformamidase
MRIIDISMAIHRDMRVYKDLEEKRPSLVRERIIPRNSINESRITMNLHTGTHIDSPLHMMEDGWATEMLQLEKLIRPCRVLDLLEVEDGITRTDLLQHGIKAGEFLLLKTRNSYKPDIGAGFIYLKQDGAAYLAGLCIAGVGTDALGIERGQPDHATHLILMSADILIIEGLELKDVPAGHYFMLALPIKIRDAEGAPARVVLLDSLPGIS